MAVNLNIQMGQQGGQPQQGYPQGYPQQGGYPQQQGYPGQYPGQQQPGFIQQQPGMMQPGMMQPGMMQPGMMQPGMMQPGFQPGFQQPIIVIQQGPGFAPPKLGLEKLNELQGVFIRQKFMLLEALTGCDQENKYNVYKLSADGTDKKGKPIFKAKEKSGFCARQCLHPSCRPFTMNVHHEDERNDIDDPFLKLDRPFACACLCCCRPFMDVFFVENGANDKIGTAKAPWTCYDHQIDVHNASDDLRYKIVANCCQLGFHCKWPCDPCQHIHFDIRNSGGENIGSLEKFSQGCIKASIEDSSNFTLNFPANIDPKEKALLVAATLLIDFRFFEEKPQNNQQY